METKKGPIKTTVLLKGDYMGFHVSLGECNLTDMGSLLGTLLGTRLNYRRVRYVHCSGPLSRATT